MKKSLVSRLLAILSLALLLWKPDLAFVGAKNGLLLWGLVVLPTLLPFMICSQVIVGIQAAPLLVGPLMPFFRWVLGLSKEGGYVLLSGLLCGYPMGAKTCGEFLRQGKISKQEADYLLAISNHPSPMFLLGYVMSQLKLIEGLAHPVSVWQVLASLYLPVLPLAALARKVYKLQPEETAFSPRPSLHSSKTLLAHSFSFDKAMMSCVETMVKIGGYIMLFSILAVYIARLPFQNPLIRCSFLGAIEITTGIQAVASSVKGGLAVLLILASSSFGGFSGIFQTRSVMNGPWSPEKASNSGVLNCLSIRHYVLWKLLHTFFTCLCFILSEWTALLL